MAGVWKAVGVHDSMTYSHQNQRLFCSSIGLRKLAAMAAPLDLMTEKDRKLIKATVSWIDGWFLDDMLKSLVLLSQLVGS